jgi:hypothetical protein
MAARPQSKTPVGTAYERNITLHSDEGVNMHWLRPAEDQAEPGRCTSAMLNEMPRLAEYGTQ